jgi:hypothetical protein
VAPLVAKAQARYERRGRPVHIRTSFWHRAKSWPQPRRILVKVDVTAAGLNVRSMVTNHRGRAADLIAWYDDWGTSENWIKELELDIHADRLSCHRSQANAFRLQLHSLALLLLAYFRRAGTGQGQVISPLLANIYLHYVLDEWFEHEVKPRMRGQAAEIRYADDFILCFQYREDAERVLAVLPKRFAKYGLMLHPEKTQLLAFGRSALPSRPDAPQPATFDFLGFTHVCARSRRGRFTIHVRTMRKRLRRSVKAVAQWCQQHRHDPVENQAAGLNARLRGHYQYYGRPTNYRSLWRYYRLVRRLWHKWLTRRTPGKRLTWDRFQQLLTRHPLLVPRICHAWANKGSPA